MPPSLANRLAASLLLLHAVALIAATSHALIDWHIGLFGASSPAMSPSQAGLVFGMSLLTALWALGLAWSANGEARGHATALTVALLWGFVGNGVVIAACPPPCADAFPYQDLAHVGSLIFGGAAAVASWRQLKAADGNAGWLVPGIAVGVTAGVFLLESFLAI